MSLLAQHQIQMVTVIHQLMMAQLLIQMHQLSSLMMELVFTLESLPQMVSYQLKITLIVETHISTNLLEHNFQSKTLALSCCDHLTLVIKFYDKKYNLI